LRTRHGSAENGAAAGIAAEIFEEKAGDTVNEHECAENLAVELSAFQKPHQEKEIREFDCRFEKLGWFERNVERRSGDVVRQRIGKGHAPPVMGFFSVAAAGGKAADAAEGVAEGKSGGEGIAGAERGHVVLAHVPGRRDECGDQASGKNSAGLQRADAEDFAGVRGVVAPVVDDVENLRADDASEDHENAEVPGVVAVVAEALGIADADPHAEQDSHGNEESVGGEGEAAEMKELREH
jgi:hypothetical protein